MKNIFGYTPILCSTYSTDNSRPYKSTSRPYPHHLSTFVKKLGIPSEYMEYVIRTASFVITLLVLFAANDRRKYTRQKLN